MPNTHSLKHAKKQRGAPHFTEAQIRWVDRVLYVVVFAYPLSSVPQILKIYTEKNAESISVLSWIMFIVFALVWMVYGFVHRDRHIVISNTLWISTYVAILVGAIIY